jgi:fibronectin type 3 domain-containing protein
MSLFPRIRIGADLKSTIAQPKHMSIEKSYAAKPRLRSFVCLALLSVLAYSPCKADVPPPLAPPQVPTDYCGVLYDEMYTDLQTFNTELQTPPAWTPVSGGPTVYAAALAWANANAGPQISGPEYLPAVLAQLQEVKALGVQAVSVPVLFPILYEPFYGSQTALQPYLTFYTSIAQAVRAAGLKLIVDDEIMFSNDIQAGWTNTNAFYSTLTWTEYMAARAEMAATVAQAMQPDFLVLANEPDTESAQTGQLNLNVPADAAQMIAGEIAAVQALNLPNPPKLGAGFGSWLTSTGDGSLVNYTNAYLALPLDYIDFHLLPVNTVQDDNFLDNTLLISSMAAAAGKPVAVGQAWLSKVAGSEWQFGYDVAALDLERSRQTFSFWAPLDAYFMQTAQTLANYTQMLYLDLEQTFFLAAYQPYGGTTSNGGSASCTCTTSSCSDYSIMAAENPLAGTADSQSIYTTTAFSYYNQLVTTPDVTPPSAPASLTGTASTTQVGLTWTASTDDIGVAGYNVYRCTPPAAGQPCTGVWIANTTLPSYIDPSLTSNTPYNYQVQAFDMANNHSDLSNMLSLQTFRTSADAATNLVAKAVSGQEIDLSWSAPSDTTGLSQYLIFAGTSPSNVQQVAARPSSQITYKNLNLSPGTTYYFGIVAMEQGIQAPLSTEAFATTLPLPNPPSNVVGTPAATSIALAWQQNSQPNGLPVSSYQIFQGTTQGALIKVASTTATKYTAAGLTPNTAYYFELQAVDTGHDDSVLSDQITVTTDPMPAAPVIGSAIANSATQVTVSWSETIPPNGMPISTYTIFRGTSPSTLGSVTTRTTTQYIDTTAGPNTTYYYAVEATDTGKDVSVMSNPVAVTTPPMPAAPSSVVATATSATQVTVSWSEIIPAGGLPIQSYNVYRGTAPTGLTKLSTRTTTVFNDTGLSPNTTYYYSIQATDTGKDVSPMSGTAQVATVPTPAAPVSVVATENSASQITVTWIENIPAGGLPISNYTVYRGTAPNSLTKLGSRTTNKYIDTGLTPYTTYYYAVQATDSGRDVSPMSATAQATTP